MLLDPREEQIDLPAAHIESADGRCRKGALVGDEHQRLARLGVLEADAPQVLAIELAGLDAGERNGLVADDTAGPVGRRGVDPSCIYVRLGTRDEERAGWMEGMKPREVDVATIHDVVIQTRHRILERPLRSDQILVFQVPYPDPLVVVEANAGKRREMHGAANYARLWTKLYEDMVTFDEITISHRYPTRIAGHYVIDPSPIPRWDVPKLDDADCLYLFGAGREKRIYAVPPHTKAEPLSFSDVPFRVEDFTDSKGQRRACVRCGATNTFLDELLASDGNRTWACSDTDYCNEMLETAECGRSSKSAA